MRIANIQRFCMHDGPGVRTTVFLKGCPLRCAWCHNPETQSTRIQLLFYERKCIGCGACTVCPQNVHSFLDTHELNRSACLQCGVCVDACPTGALELCGKDVSAEELLKTVGRDEAFYGADGGITLSGGEPLMQEDAVPFLRLCKEKGYTTAVETCGMVSAERIKQAVPVTDLFLWDVKDTDSVWHEQYTGVSNEQILENLILADHLGAKTRLRCILVNGVNMRQAHYESLLQLLRKLQHCEGIEFMPYHSYGGSKSMALGAKNSGNDSWIPTKEQLAQVKSFFVNNGTTVY